MNLKVYQYAEITAILIPNKNKLKQAIKITE